MVVGFVGDALFFQRIDLWQVQTAFLAYLTVAALSILILHVIETRAQRGLVRPRWRSILPIATQYALGGFWSATLIFYGRSSAFSVSWPFLFVLIALFIGNEYFKRYHARLVFTSILFFFAVYAYAIFALPIATHSMGNMIFIASGIIALAIFGLFTILLRFFGRERFYTDIWRIRIGAIAVLFVMNVSYFTNILPPLPLTSIATGIYHHVSREPGKYLAAMEVQPWYRRYLELTPTMHVIKGDSLYAYAAVFAPTALETIIVHRWQLYDKEEKRWVTRASIRYKIEGGRDLGYRGYSTALMNTEGRWRVSVETEDQKVLARMPFTVKFVDTQVPTKREVLKK